MSIAYEIIVQKEKKKIYIYYCKKRIVVKYCNYILTKN